MTTSKTLAAPSDVYLACRCPECGGREVRITLRRYRSICRLPSPAHEAAIHAAVIGGEPLTLP